MLNTKKLLYVLPDVAYLAELLPAKKEHTFSIQAFRQINGEFIVDEELVTESVDKLFSKLEKDEYHVILPDFLFTNTILQVKETTETKIKQHLEEKILPSLTLSKDTHQIDTFTLTQFQGASKVQLSALENSVLAPILEATQHHPVTVAAISPLSWTLKALISLEPSISVVQLGSNLYLAQHYIGVDQTTSWTVSEIENIAETIKTLKGSEPSIQTLYLLTNDLVEDKLKELLSGTLPLQQLTPGGEETADLPSYVKAVVETSSKTLDIADFPVPIFALPKSIKADAAVEAKVIEPEIDIDDDEAITPEPEPEKPSIDQDEIEEENQETMTLPKPAAPIIRTEVEEPVEETVKETVEKTAEEIKTPVEEKEQVATIEAKETTPVLDKPVEQTALPEPEPVAALTEPEEDKLLAQFATATQTEAPMNESHTDTVTSSSERPNLDLSQTGNGRHVIKNPAANNHMLKMIGIFVLVMVVTIGLGVGVGLGLLSLSNKGEQLSPTTSPTPAVAVASPSPMTSAAPSASPSAGLDRSKYSVLVVNATTVAGKAGDLKADLEKAGFKNVKAGNAKGKYDGGVVVLMKEEDEALIAQLEKDLDLTLTFNADIKTEDPSGVYDIVIAFADQK
jgi:hypothetical protein